MKKITEDIYYAGVNDHQVDLFEGQFAVPNGMAYNSYVIMDEKIAVMDTVDVNFGEEWLANVAEILGDRKPDYLVVQHMEPDHSANITKFVEAYPEAKVVGNAKTFQMIENFFGLNLADKQEVVTNNGTLSLGSHELTFVFAPMVHWPEVMVTYDSNDKILFSADAFGKFGALDAEEGWACEARRYYFGIVGKYGAQVQALLKKAVTLDIEKICPLHGPILTENLGYYLDLYQTWSSYGVETEGVMIAYASVYGNTKKAAELLGEELKANGCPRVVVADLPEKIAKLAKIAAFYRNESDTAAAFAAQAERLRARFGGSFEALALDRVIEASSTALRAGMASGTSEAMLEPQVYGYILREHLYGTNLDLKRLTVQQLRPIALSYLKAKRCAHVLGTAATAVKLAEKYGADVHRAEVAGLLHDCTKKLSMPEQLALCEKYGIALDALEKKALKLLHAKTGAALARDVFGVDDEIYNAILWHTTGKPDMTVLEKVIYLADFIEPTRDFPGVDALRRTVWEDLDRGLLMGLEMTVEEMEEMGNPIHVNTLAARDYLKGKTNEGKAGSGQQL